MDNVKRWNRKTRNEAISFCSTQKWEHGSSVQSRD